MSERLPEITSLIEESKRRGYVKVMVPVDELKYLLKLAEERGAALEWYSNPNNYMDSLEPYQCPFTKRELIRYQTIDAEIKADRGERARQALGKEPQP